MIKKNKMKTKKIKTNKTNKTKKTNKIILNTPRLTARIIFGHNYGGIVVDKNTIKEIIESIGGEVEIVVFNDIKDILKPYLKSYSNKQVYNKVYNKVDIQIFIEHIFLENPLDKFPADKSYIFVNQEYMNDWDITGLQSGSIIPLCKTHESLKTLRNLGITHAKYVGFGNNKEFKYIDNISKIPNLFIHIVGSSPLKGTKTLIDTWIYKKINYPLIITANNKARGNTNLFKYWKSLKPKSKPLPDIVLKKWKEWTKLTSATTFHNAGVSLPQFEKIESSSVYFCNTELDYSIIQFLQSVAGVHICPSLIEGWGQYIDEGRRAKAVVLTLDAPPMNELIKDGTTGILVKASKGPTMRQLLPPGWTMFFTKDKEYNKFLYGTYKTNINDLYNSINRIIKMTPESKRQLGINSLKQSQYDYKKFKEQFIKVLQL